MLHIKFIRLLFRGYLSFHAIFLRLVPRVFPSARLDMLKEFLALEHAAHQRFILECSFPRFFGLHPKNIFNFRAQFFLQNVKPDDIVLDIACGTGSILKVLGPAIKKGIGLELNDANLELCKVRHGEPNLEYRKADIMNLDYAAFREQERVTVGIFSHILEHVKDPAALLRAVGLKTLLICVPSQENWLAQLKLSLGLSCFSDTSHYREYTRKMLEEELVAAGYSVVDLGFNSEGEIVCRAVLRS